MRLASPLVAKQPAAHRRRGAGLARPEGLEAARHQDPVGRLLNKGAISAVAEARRYLYSPLLQQQDRLSAQSLGVLDRWFDGHIKVSTTALHTKRGFLRGPVAAARSVGRPFSGV